jgi:hypothetical protein
VPERVLDPAGVPDVVPCTVAVAPQVPVPEVGTARQRVPVQRAATVGESSGTRGVALGVRVGAVVPAKRRRELGAGAGRQRVVRAMVATKGSSDLRAGGGRQMVVLAAQFR